MLCILILLCQIWISVEDELFPKLPMGISNTPSMLCNNHSDLLVREFENLTLWAHKVRDATAKSSLGALSGNIYNFGQFDQCMGLEAPLPFQYCLVTVKAQIPRPNVSRDTFSLYFQPQSSVLERMYDFGDEQQQVRNFVTLGWCIPESCSPIYLEEFLQKYMNEQDSVLSRNNVSYLIQVPSNLCQKQTRDQPFEVIDISFCVLSVILLLVTITATIADSYKNIFGETINSNIIVCAFSIKRNFKELRKSDQYKSDKSSIFFGLKTIGIILIVGGHKIVFRFSLNMIANLDFLEEQYRHPMNMIFARTDLIVDIFFFVSGWLAICSILNIFEKKSLSPWMLVFLRYVRLTPAYAFVVYYYTTVISYTGSGPLWPLMEVEKADCKQNWWTNLIYLSNYINTDHICAPHTWYLNCDFHYFIAAVGICYVIKRKTKLGLILLIMLIGISILTVFVLTTVYHESSMIRLTPGMIRELKTHHEFTFLYTKSHGRASTYFTGMLAGYLLSWTNTLKNKISKVKSWILLSASILFLLAPVYSSVLYFDPHHKYNNIEAGAFAALHRVIWILGLSGLIYLIFCGYCQTLRKILSWSPFIVLSKLSYAAYLIHLQIVFRSNLVERHPGSIIGLVEFLSNGLSDVPLVFFSALVIYLCIEAPCKNILQHILARKLPPAAQSEFNKTNINLEAPSSN